MSEFVATSVARRLIARMNATHDRRRVAVFAGPPGIGKTTAIDEFSRRRPGEIAVVKIAKRNAREVLVLQHALEALRRLTASPLQNTASSLWELRKELFNAVCAWAGADPISARRGDYDPQQFARLTLIFDEAQNLSREAIDALRYWNDPDRCYAPFPLGLVFVGNNEFSMAGATASESVISAAVADRALYLQRLEYDDIADNDLELFIETQGEFQPSTTAAIVRSFRGPRSLRSLRRLSDLISDLRLYSADAEITPEHVRQHLSLL